MSTRARLTDSLLRTMQQAVMEGVQLASVSQGEDDLVDDLRRQVREAETVEMATYQREAQ